MSKPQKQIWVLALVFVLLGGFLPAAAQNVLTYHGRPDRSGNFVMPEFTWDRVRDLQQDTAFSSRFTGNLYAQPLYWKPSDGGSGRLLVASESNTVAAIDAVSGATIWTRSLGAPASRATLPCGNIDPLGTTGTPVIDEAINVVYLDAMISEDGPVHHRIFALSLHDGAVLPGWPIDVADALRGIGQNFEPRVHNQRGALLILGGTLYVPFGGHFGDCGDYHGWVVGIPLDNRQRVLAWGTRGRGGGIWAPGGIASDGQSLFVATGNTLGANEWADGEAVFRLAPDLRHSEAKADFFAMADWRAADSRDADLGGTNPLPVDLPAGNGVQPVVLALGKDQKAYLLDRRNLGGIGGSLLAERVANDPILTAPAAWPQGDGVYVAFGGHGARCPGAEEGRLHGGITALRLRGGTHPLIDTAWCGSLDGAGAPILTTTDGHSNPTVWIIGAEGDNRLHGFRGDTGEALFASAPLAGLWHFLFASAPLRLRHFQTLIAADNRLYVGADGRLYAFALPPVRW